MKKSQNQSKYREIRAILIGWVRYEGIFCLAADSFRNVTFSGLNNGATAARVFGYREKDRVFEASKDCSFNIERLSEEIYKKTLNIRKFRFQFVYLVNEPEALVYLIRPVITNPVVVVLKPQKNIIEAEFCTARGFFAGLHLKRMIRNFTKVLPEVFTASGEKEKKNDKK